MKVWRNIIKCDICQFRYNGNVLAESLNVVEYRWYHWCKSRAVQCWASIHEYELRSCTLTCMHTRVHTHLIGWSDQGGWSGTCSVRKGDGKSWSENRKEGTPWEIYAWMEVNIKVSLTQWSMNVSGGFVWLRIMSSDGVLGTLSRTLGFHERQELFSPVEQASL